MAPLAIVRPRLCALALCGVLLTGCDVEDTNDQAVAGVGTGGIGGTPAQVGEAGMSVAAVGGGAGAAQGGAAGAGAQGGSANAQGGTAGAALGAGGMTAAGPVHVVHGFLPNAEWLTIVIQGYGLTAHEGLPVHVRVGHLDRPEWSRCWGSSHILGGGFSVTLPECDEVSVYKRRLAFIDVNQDGVCNEPVYGNSAAIREDATFTLSDSNPAPPASESMGTLFTEGDCAVFNEPWPEE